MIFAVAAVCETLAYLIPWVDHAFDVIAAPLAVAAGALMAPIFKLDPMMGEQPLLKAFIIIILEILRTVVARYTDGVFQLQNFLIIGVIAAVRHILTVGASMTLASGKSQSEFDRAVVELGISSGIVVALVFAIFLARASNNFPSKTVKTGASN